MKKFLFAIFVIALFLSLKSGKTYANGFDEFGYNLTARNFVGPISGWCKYKGISMADCGAYGFGSVNDKLVMKWNAEWDRGNDENWSKPPYKAWENNEWNGKVPGGSGVIWHYKIVWVGQCEEGATIAGGGYCIWGQFAVIMDQGTDPLDGHTILTLGKPAGYGAYFGK